MRKIALLGTLFTALVTLQSCTIEEYYDDGYNSQAQVFELTNETLSTQEDDYTFSAIWDFTVPLYDSDNVLVYRWDGAAWVILPATYNLGGSDVVRYDYDFTPYDIKVYFSANFPVNQLTNAEYNQFVYRQTFRVVVLPGGFQQKTNYSDYNATIKALGLENTPMKTLRLRNK